MVVSNYYTESTKTVTLGISQGLPEPDDVKTTGAKISVNKTDIVLKKGQSVELTVTGSGDCPDTYHFSCNRYTDIQAEWGDWIDNNSATITLTGNNSNDTGYIRFTIVDGETEEAIGYTDIFITVQ